MSEGVSYFAPGPAKLPNEVLLKLRDDVTEYANTRISILELSHRSKDFGEIMKRTEGLVRRLLSVPDNYKVFFCHGGGRGQFSAVPLNLMNTTGKADYIVTGSWSAKAAEEAEKYGKVNRPFKLATFKRIPDQETWALDPNADYLFYCDNETIDGIEFDFLPTSLKSVPLVCDMSSNFFTRPVDVSKFGIIFGGAQKNMGCAGVTLVIVRDDLLGSASPICPSFLNYAGIDKFSNIFNTPPTFPIYVLGEVLAWIENEGGVHQMEKLAKIKSKLLYDVIGKSEGFYCNDIENSARSRMNVVFRLGSPPNEPLEDLFVKEAAEVGLLSLKGHRSVGGIRASLYNAVSVKDVEKLVKFMDQFKGKHDKL